jgi:hypothetical protein
MSAPGWRKSSRSQGYENSDCVEVAKFADAIGIRDSKNAGGANLAISGRGFTALLARIKRGELDRRR